MAFLAALFGLPMDRGMRGIYRKHTGRTRPSNEAAKEAWLVVGRRGGKSLIAALVAVYLACFRGYAEFLAPGEAATIMVIAADRRQARVILRYITGFFDNIPMLSQLVRTQTKEAIELTNRVVIEIHTASFRSTRGYTMAAAICDEIAYWRSEESATPDTEILTALRPGLATIPNSLLMCISSPYARRGALWHAYQKHYGKDKDPVLVWQAPTRAMNSTITQGVIDAAYDDDESAAGAEYGAEFRRDIESFVQREVIGQCVVEGRHELARLDSFGYFAFADPSGGSADSFTLAVSHQEMGGVVLDCVRERKPPFSPEQVVEEYARLLKEYRCRRVVGDRYAGEWPREQFRKHGIEYIPSVKTKSDLYRDLLPILNSGKAELLDNARLVTQLCGLERRVARGGKDSIDHAPNSHDDVANAVAGALVLGSTGRVPGDLGYS